MLSKIVAVLTGMFGFNQQNPFAGYGLDQLTGQVFFVHSGTGSTSFSGRAPTQAKATIGQALALCTANRGDTIILMDGHSETVTGAGGVNINVSGVRVIGRGVGSARPTFNMTTNSGADVLVTADNVYVENVLFTGGIDALANPLAILANDCYLANIETKDVTGQATDFVFVDGSSARLTIDGWIHRGASAAGADSALHIEGGDGHVIRNFRIDGNFAAGAIENQVAAMTNVTINNGYIRTRNSADICIAMLAATSGNIGPNLFFRLQDNAANITECMTLTTQCHFFDPIMVVNADTERGLQWNQTVSADA